MSRFFNLPSAWNPGYVLPQNVEAEPPGRGTLTTQWLPRGTIDAEVPEYTLGEGRRILGRADADLGSLAGNCFSGGSSLSGSTLDGDSLGAMRYQLQPTGLGATSVRAASGAPSVLTQYGKKTARGLIARIARLPKAQRANALKQAMGQIDKTLQARTERYAKAARARGVPVGQALEVGLGQALSEGVVSELAQLGRGRRRSTGPLAGLLSRGGGRHRAMSALGAESAGYVPKSSNPANIAYVPQASGTDDSIAAQVAKVKQAAHVMVGPFPVPNTAGADKQIFRYRISDPNQLPSDWKAFIHDKIQSKVQYLSPNNLLRANWEPGVATASPWYAALGFAPGTALPMAFFNSRSEDGYRPPLALFKHPVSGNMWGVYLAFNPDDQNPRNATVFFRWLPENSWYSGIIGVIAAIVGAPVKGAEAVVKAAEWVGEQTCNLLGSPNAIPAAAAVNPAAGAGAVIANLACGNKAVPPPSPQSSNTMLWILLGGGALLGAIALIPQD